MNLPALSAEIVKRVQDSEGDSNHNIATVVQNLIAEAIKNDKILYERGGNRFEAEPACGHRLGNNAAALTHNYEP